MAKLTKADIARKYRDKYGLEMASLQLARIIHKKEPAFTSIEDARTALRYIEGKSGGEKSRNGQKQSAYAVPERARNPYNLPDTYKEDRKPFKLPLACNNILLISDIHIPYHDIEAVTVALDYGKKHKVNTIFINGDLIDFARISRFEQDMSKRSVKDEIAATKSFLKTLRKNFPAASIYWLKGNHDTRLEKYLAQKAPELFDDPYYHLEERLQLNEERVTLLDDKILVKAGKLSITHGHHIFKGVFAPVSPARGAFLRAKQSVIVGHLHRASHHIETDLEGKTISCYSTSCLCELRPNYSPLVSNSTHGFAHVMIENNGDYHVKNYQIIEGKLY